MSEIELPAYADESVRGNRYLLAVVVLEVPSRGGACREQARAKARSLGRSSLHFSRLLPPQRSESLELFGDLSGLRSKVFEHRQQRGESEMDARAVVLAALIEHLQNQSVSSLVLDQFQGAEQIDGPIIRRERALRQAVLTYGHRNFGDEPLLWIADGIAYNAGAKHPDVFPAWHQGTTQV